MLYIKPTGGLGNYLRVIFSWLSVARARNEHLTVVWAKTTSCNGQFDELFEPVEGMTVVQWTTKPLIYEGCEACGDYSLVKELRLKSLLNVEQQWPAAIHVRGTDFGMPDYGQFERFIESVQGPVFLATDDVVTQRHFLAKYPEQIKIREQIINRGSLRQTSLKTAVIDLFTCAKAERFLGTKNSSFTDIIQLLRTTITLNERG